MIRHPPVARKISIHVPREGDDILLPPLFPTRWISIHVPREGDDAEIKRFRKRRSKFLSTSPARGTTCRVYISSASA